MTERPILFSGDMIRAVLEGRKTMTRRVVKPQPLWVGDPAVPFKTMDADPKGIIRCPFGQPGSKLWVRETFKTTSSPSPTVIYRADRNNWIPDAGWRPSIFMPRWASRITLLVTAVRVERLQEISEEDAVAEGSYLGRCECLPKSKDRTPLEAAFSQTWCHLHGGEFKSLWQSLNAKRPGCLWEDNPFVFVIEFEPIKVGGE